jgi:hypothetical protein
MAPAMIRKNEELYKTEAVLGAEWWILVLVMNLELKFLPLPNVPR